MITKMRPENRPHCDLNYTTALLLIVIEHAEHRQQVLKEQEYIQIER